MNSSMLQDNEAEKQGAPVPKDRHEPVLLALGANIDSIAGTPAQTIEQSLLKLAQIGIGIIQVSRFHRTPAFPKGNGPDFVNAAALCKTDLPPEKLLHAVHDVENMFDRVRAERWSARTLDIDILAMGDLVSPSREKFLSWQTLSAKAQLKSTPKELILPHPRMQDRGFVLVPLAEVAANWVHPVFGLSVAQMRDALPRAERAEIATLP